MLIFETSLCTIAQQQFCHFGVRQKSQICHFHQNPKTDVLKFVKTVVFMFLHLLTYLDKYIISIYSYLSSYLSKYSNRLNRLIIIR